MTNPEFAGSLCAGKRAAAVMSLVHSAKLNGLDPHAYLRNVLERLPRSPAGRIGELLLHTGRPLGDDRHRRHWILTTSD